MRTIYLVLLLLFGSTQIFAGPLKEIIFFGDSLSDNGNLYRVIKIIPKSPPYFEGRFSNGATWAEQLGNFYQNKYKMNYQIYAFGGATVILRGPIEGAPPLTLKHEIRSYLSNTRGVDRLNTLFVVWIGANDYLDEKRQEVNALTTEVINEMVVQIKTLINNGAQNLLIMDLPDLSLAPYAQGLDQEQKNRLATLTQLHHQKLLGTMSDLQRQYPNLKFHHIDIYTIFKDLLANTDAYNKKYNQHITNTTDVCWTGGYLYKQNMADAAYINSVALTEASLVGKSYSLEVLPCANPDDFIYWDKVHPTFATHKMFTSIIIEKLIDVMGG